MTIWSSTQNPHILQDDDRGDERPRARTRSAPSRRKSAAASARRSTSTPRSTSARSSRSSSACRSSGSRIDPRRSSRRRTGATSSATSTSPRERDGKVLGLKMRLIADIGAYNMLLTAAIPTLTMLMANGTYDIPAIRTTLTEVFTNKTPTDAYRGAGRPEATYFVERAMDMLARELKMDPAELRRQELHPVGPVPVSDADGRGLRLRRLREGARRGAEGGELERRSRPSATQARKEGRLVGLGLAMYVEVCGLGPSSSLPTGGWEHAQVTDRARRPHHRDDRRVAARPGQRDDVRADAGGSVQRADRAHHDPARRHRRREAGHRHVRQPLAGRRRHGAAPGRRQGQDEDGEVRRGAARSAARTTSSSRTARSASRARRPSAKTVRRGRRRTPTCRCRCRRASSRA